MEAAVAWIANVVWVGLMNAGVGYAAAAYIAVGVAYAVVLYGAYTIAMALAPDMPDIDSRQREIQGLVRGTAEPNRIVYGTARVGGVVVFNATSGDNNEYLWYVIAIGSTNGAPYEEVTSIYLDDIAYNLTSDFTSSILDVGDYAGLVQCVVHLGSDSQGVDTGMYNAFTQWTNSHVGKGVCYAVVRLERNDEVFDHIPAITFLVKGAKIYDPRLDTTVGGSGTHRYATPSTWEWSNNPALCLADYLVSTRYGMGETWTRINLTTLAASANVCEETPAIPGATTQLRYTCDGVLFTNTRHIDNISYLRSSMLGVMTYSRGQYLIYAGDYTAPTVTLTDNDLAGQIKIKASLPADQKYNSVRGNYVDAARGYQLVGFNPRTSATYVTQDSSEVIWKDLDLPLTNNEYRAQGMATVLLEQSRNEQRITGTFNLRAYRMSLWEMVTLQITELGINGTYRVMGWKFNPQGTVDLSLQADTSAAWADPADVDYGTASTVTPTATVQPVPSVPTNVSADGTYGGIAISWSQPGDKSATKFEVSEYTASTPYTSGTVVWSGDSTSCWRAFSTVSTRYYWVRSVGSNGQKSAFVGVGSGYGAGATSLVPANVPLTVTFDKSSVYGAGATPVTTESITATAAGGSGTGYTYAWTAVSGDTTITANTASAATTTFNGTTSNDERIFKCVVDDSVGGGPTDSSNITVTIGSAGLEATANPTYLAKTYSGGGTKTTASTTVTPTGATGTPTYAWTLLSGSTLITPDSPTAATTTFSYSGIGEPFSTYRCTVTDDVTSVTVDIQVEFIKL